MTDKYIDISTLPNERIVDIDTLCYDSGSYGDYTGLCIITDKRSIHIGEYHFSHTFIDNLEANGEQIPKLTWQLTCLAKVQSFIGCNILDLRIGSDKHGTSIRISTSIGVLLFKSVAVYKLSVAIRYDIIDLDYP